MNVNYIGQVLAVPAEASHGVPRHYETKGLPLGRVN